VQRSSATVVCIIGGVDVASLSRANVSTLSPPSDLGPLERATQATETAGGTHAPYFVHDADPLALVADAWVRLFEGAGPIGEVEVAVAETLARARVQTIELPDYYLVADADAMTPTRRHWYFGVLHDAVPLRVVPVPSNAHQIVDALEQLAATRWWPPVPQLLDRIEHRAPDAAPGVIAPDAS
jgi:hypothetical protein